MNKIGKTENTLVLRTHVSNSEEWDQVCAEIETPDPEEGFMAYVSFLSDLQYKDISIETLMTLINPKEHWFIFVVDKETLSSPEHPILWVEFIENPGNSFRFIPSEMWWVENNLSIANMDFESFADSVDPDGLFRGFQEY